MYLLVLEFICICNAISFIHTFYFPGRYEIQSTTDAENIVHFFTFRIKVLIDTVINLVTQKEKKSLNLETGVICIPVVCTHDTNAYLYIPISKRDISRKLLNLYPTFI